MKTIIKYKSESGREFDTQSGAAIADELFAKQNEVSMLLPQAVDDSCDFSNGGGYVQHTQQDIDKFTAGIRELIVLEFGENSATLKAWDTGGPYGIVGRYLDDSNSDTYRLWGRLYSIDPRLREWGQGYYARNIPENPRPWPNVERRGMKYFGA